MRVLTWNLFAPYGFERLPGNPGYASRARALLAEAAAIQPDLVVWQEATPAFVRLLRDEAFWAGYQTSSVTEDPPGGLLILSRWPLLEVVEPGLPLLSRWNDAWTLLHPQQAGYTYDLARNPRAREQAFPKEPSRRLDRVLLTPGLRPKAMGFVGEGASGATPPSDHYGLWVELRLPSGG